MLFFFLLVLSEKVKWKFYYNAFIVFTTATFKFEAIFNVIVEIGLHCATSFFFFLIDSTSQLYHINKSLLTSC